MAKHLIETLPDAKGLAMRAAELVAHEIANAVKERGRAAIAISGGTTPRMLFEALSREPYESSIPWGKVHVFFADERCVPPDHAESNFGMANALLLSRIAAHAHRIRGEYAPEDAAWAYESEISSALGDAPVFDLVLLGMGADGHTASLFPYSAALRTSGRLAVAVTDRTSRRVSLTLEAINAARRVAFIVCGADKAETLRRVLDSVEPDEGLPASMVRPASGPVLWLVDRAAMGGL